MSRQELLLERELGEAIARNRYNALMGLVTILFIALTMAISSAMYGIFAILLNVFVWAAFGVSFLLAWIASRAVPEEAPERSGWLPDMLAAVAFAVMSYSVLSGQPGLFYGVVVALSMLGLLVTRPKFRTMVEPALNGALTGFVSFIIVLMISVVVGSFVQESFRDVIGASVLSIMQVTPLAMLFLVAFPEELWARAWMLSGMSRVVGRRTAVFWSTFLFIALHIPSRVATLGLGTILLPIVIGMIGIAILPIVYIYAKYAEHPIFSIAAHTVYNSLIYAVFAGDVVYMVASIAFLAAAIYVLRMYGLRVVGREKE